MINQVAKKKMQFRLSNGYNWGLEGGEKREESFKSD